MGQGLGLCFVVMEEPSLVAEKWRFGQHGLSVQRLMGPGALGLYGLVAASWQEQREDRESWTGRSKDATGGRGGEDRAGWTRILKKERKEKGQGGGRLGCPLCQGFWPLTLPRRDHSTHTHIPSLFPRPRLPPHSLPRLSTSAQGKKNTVATGGVSARRSRTFTLHMGVPGFNPSTTKGQRS